MRGPCRRMALLGVAAILTGCGRPSEESVFVDLAQISTSAMATMPPPMPVPSPEPGPIRYELPARPESSLNLGAADRIKQEAEERIWQDREEALAQLERQLRSTFDAETDRFIRASQADLRRLRGRLGDAAYTELSELFRRQALDVGRLHFELAALAGYPDPDTGSTRPLPTEPLALSRARRAVEVRRELVEVRGQFDRVIRERLAAISAQVDRELENLLAQLTARREAFERDLEAERQRYLAAAAASSPMPRLDRQAVLPASPEVAVEVLPPASRAQAPAEPSAPPTIFDEVRHDLNIWLAVRRYRLTSDPRRGRDATDEFRQWRQRTRLGPSANSPNSLARG